MFDTLSSFAAELRRLNIPVSLGEMTDAVAAVDATDLNGPEDLRFALRTTMIKRVEHLEAFDVVFNLFFRTLGRSEDSPSPPGAEEDVFAALTGDELVTELSHALARDNRPVLARLAEVGVVRFAEMEPGRSVAGRSYVFRVLSHLDVDDALDQLTEGLADQTTLLARRLRSQQLEASADFFRSQVELEVRRHLVADKGAAEVARLVRPIVPESVGFMNASTAEMADMRRAIAPLARKLATSLAHRAQVQGGHGPLDFRRTVRHSLSTGGAPLTLRFKPPSKPKSELVVIADVSGSVATFARFTLQFLYAMRLQFRRIRTFAFIDSLLEVTDALLDSATAEDAFSTITADPGLIWLDGRSDYGHAFEVFEETYHSAVGSRTSVLILGDARSNYRAPQADLLHAISRRAAAVYWLNPERIANWDSGDSITAIYAPYCQQIVECADLRQLREFANTLVASSR